MNEYHDELPTLDEIRKTDDLDTLADWHEDAVDLLDSLKAQLSAARLVGALNAEYEGWIHRTGAKAGYAGSTLRRIERRILALGGPLPLTVEREEREQIAKLKRRVSSLEHFLRKQGLFPDETD